ncbi:MAG: hemolysin family protein [Eubacteriales bacterium]
MIVTILIMCAAILLLLVCSAFFAGTESAFACCNKLRLRSAAEKGDRRAKIAEYILDHFGVSISTILLSNNLVNILTSTLGTLIAAMLIASESLAQTAATVVITLLILICGEILPKIIAAQFADRLVLKTAPILRIVMKIFYPIVFVVDFVLSKLSPLWTPKEEAPTVTQEELVTIVDEMEESGNFTEEEGDLVRASIEFADLTAKDILTPRVDTLAFDIEDSPAALLSNRDLLEFSRFPVYEESLDHVIGILSTQRFVETCYEVGVERVDIRKLMTPPVYVHMTRAIASILEEMREKHCEMVVVLDEFGGTMGILTVEDIVEEIVGDIFDETDAFESDFVKRIDGYDVDGSMNLHDFFDLIGLDDSTQESEYTTAGGWATEMLDKLPEEGDRFEFENYTVTVLKVDAMRVERLLVHVHPKNEEEEDE